MFLFLYFFNVFTQTQSEKVFSVVSFIFFELKKKQKKTKHSAKVYKLTGTTVNKMHIWDFEEHKVMCCAHLKCGSVKSHGKHAKLFQKL